MNIINGDSLMIQGPGGCIEIVVQLLSIFTD